MPKLRQIATLYKAVWTSKSMYGFYCFITHIFLKQNLGCQILQKHVAFGKYKLAYIQEYHFRYSSICLKQFHIKTVQVQYIVALLYLVYSYKTWMCLLPDTRSFITRIPYCGWSKSNQGRVCVWMQSFQSHTEIWSWDSLVTILCKSILSWIKSKGRLQSRWVLHNGPLACHPVVYHHPNKWQHWAP